MKLPPRGRYNKTGATDSVILRLEYHAIGCPGFLYGSILVCVGDTNLFFTIIRILFERALTIRLVGP